MSQPVLVFLHGLYGDSSDWQAIANRLDWPVRCLSIPYPDWRDTPAEQGFRQAHQWLEQQLADLERFILVGYSLGGRLALSFASTNPRGLAGLFLESCHPGLASEQERQARLDNDRVWAERMTSLDNTEFFALWYQQGVFSDLSAEQREQLSRQRQHLDLTCLTNFYLGTSLARQEDLRPLIASANFPIAYISGEKDKKFSALACQLSQLSDTLSTYACPGAGHNVHFCQPDWFYQQLTDWLGSKIPASTTREEHDDR